MIQAGISLAAPPKARRQVQTALSRYISRISKPLPSNGSIDAANRRLLGLIWKIPPVEAEANFFAQRVRIKIAAQDSGELAFGKSGAVQGAFPEIPKSE